MIKTAFPCFPFFVLRFCSFHTRWFVGLVKQATPQCPQACRHRACSRVWAPPRPSVGFQQALEGRQAIWGRVLGRPGAQAPLRPSLQVSLRSRRCSSRTARSPSPSSTRVHHVDHGHTCQQRGGDASGLGGIAAQVGAPAPHCQGYHPSAHTPRAEPLRARGTCPGPHSQPGSASCR